MKWKSLIVATVLCSGENPWVLVLLWMSFDPLNPTNFVSSRAGGQISSGGVVIVLVPRRAVRSARVFGWMACVNWHGRKCQDPELPSSTVSPVIHFTAGAFNAAAGQCWCQTVCSIVFYYTIKKHVFFYKKGSTTCSKGDIHKPPRRCNGIRQMGTNRQATNPALLNKSHLSKRTSRQWCCNGDSTDQETLSSHIKHLYLSSDNKWHSSNGYLAARPAWADLCAHAWCQCSCRFSDGQNSERGMTPSLKTTLQGTFKVKCWIEPQV